MRTYAIAHGVPAAAITLDYAGFDTYDSCFRARHIFDVTTPSPRYLGAHEQLHLQPATARAG
jgi:vancomycin permeability regulator SanA